jgi:hypothetical protein
MSRGRPDGEKKLNGSAKPVSSGDTDPLPPDWELRHPRSGGRAVYYYNTRTHECTWTLPVSSVKSSSFSRDKDQGKTHPPESRSGGKLLFDGTDTKGAEPSTVSRLGRPEPESQVISANLSYEDRHYRPGPDNAQKPSQEANRRDDRQLQNTSYSGNSYTPPASPKLEPVRTSWLRDRERQDRHQPYRQSSPHETSGNDAQPRESQQGSLSHSERRWDSSRDLPSEAASRRRPVSSTSYQQEVGGVAEPESSAFEGPRNDAVWSSSPSTLSASPLLTSSAWRFGSSRGGGCIVPQCLAKPRELSCAVLYSLLLYSAPSPNRHMDAHIGFICSFPFIFFHYFSFPCPSYFFPTLSCNRTQIPTAAFSRIPAAPNLAANRVCSDPDSDCSQTENSI